MRALPTNKERTLLGYASPALDKRWRLLRGFHPEQVVLLIMSIIVLMIIGSGIAARVREGKVTSVKPGMHKTQVDRLLGAGQRSFMGPLSKIPPGSKQFAYSGNRSLWYRRLEDTLVVWYVDDVVCATERVGL